MLFQQRELSLLTFFLLSRRDFRKLELQRGDRRRIGVELVPSLFGILRLGDLRDSLGNGARDGTGFVAYDSLA